MCMSKYVCFPLVRRRLATPTRPTQTLATDLPRRRARQTSAVDLPLATRCASTETKGGRHRQAHFTPQLPKVRRKRVASGRLDSRHVNGGRQLEIRFLVKPETRNLVNSTRGKNRGAELRFRFLVNCFRSENQGPKLL